MLEAIATRPFWAKSDYTSKLATIFSSNSNGLFLHNSTLISSTFMASESLTLPSLSLILTTPLPLSYSPLCPYPHGLTRPFSLPRAANLSARLVAYPLCLEKSWKLRTKRRNWPTSLEAFLVIIALSSHLEEQRQFSGRSLVVFGDKWALESARLLATVISTSFWEQSTF
jgi:hypothetical protein